MLRCLASYSPSSSCLNDQLYPDPNLSLAKEVSRATNQRCALEIVQRLPNHSLSLALQLFDYRLHLK
jgi:hypothetical protein